MTEPGRQRVRPKDYPPGHYSATDVMRFVPGITYRQLDYWDRTDVIKPSLYGANGTGTRRRYSDGDVRAVKIIALLIASGISLQRARRIVPLLDTVTGDAFGLIDDDTVEIITDPEQLVERIRTGRVVHIFRLDGDHLTLNR